MIGANLTRFRVLNLRELFGHAVRTATLITVVAVAAALLVAVMATYSSLTGSVKQLTRSIAGDADLLITGYSDSGFDRSLTAAVAATPGVRAAVPIVQTSMTVAQPHRVSATVVGVDLSILALNSSLRTTLEPVLQLPKLQRSTNGVIVGEQLGVPEGATFSVGGRDVTAAVVVPAELATQVNDGRFIAAPMGLAQSLTGHRDKVDDIIVVAQPGTDVGALRERLSEVVGKKALVSGTGLRAVQVDNALILTRSLTLLVAAVSLVVAAFLMFNVMTMAVAQRRPQLAVLRAVGGRRTVVAADLLVEAALIGLVAALAGIPLGLGLGRWALERTPPFLLQMVSAELSFHVPAYVYPATIAGCVLATVAASLAAAYQAYRVDPMEALRSAVLAAAQPFGRRIVVGAGVAGAGLVAVAAVIGYAAHGLAVVSAAAVVMLGLLLLGLAAAGAVRWGAAWLCERSGASGRLAAASVERTPRRTWATSMTVGIAVAAGVAVYGALNDLVDSASDVFASLRATDIFVSTSGPNLLPTKAIPDHWSDRAQITPGVRQVVEGQWAYVSVGDLRVQVSGLVPGNDANVGPLLDPAVKDKVLNGQGVAVSRLLAERMGYRIGDWIEVGTPTGLQRAPIVGEFGFLTADAGVVVMDLPQMQRWFDRPGATYLVVTADHGVDIGELTTRLRDVLGPDAQVYSGERAFKGVVFNITQAGVLAVGLQWIIAAIAAVALLNTLTLSVLQRRREFGMLRSIGAARQLIGRLVVAEAIAIGAVGAVMGIVGGEGVHFVADLVLSGMTAIDIHYRLDPLVLLSGSIALCLCLAGSVPPAYQASRVRIVEAMADD
ncbi:ABC transporter permease [Nocardia transvalensis]|uniref:ABC transporter permease n=1 Tax=Nocardia transvalensis TaxID=37333 RepID=UPI00189464AE|nr:FtsX-like permease family protein [Nocardia transvalensis]MBF6333045.1 FtsX-like permease family protein [Nocardia transvalensis]